MNTGLSDQLGQIRPALSKGRPEVRVVCQVTAQLKGPESRQSYETARTAVLDWLKNAQNIQAIPDSAWQGESFEVDSTEGRPVLAETLGQFWGVLYDNPDASVPGRIWRTEAILGVGEKASLVGLRLSVISRDWGASYFKSIPKVVRNLVVAPGLKDYGYSITDEPQRILTESDVSRLVQLLESESRTRPVFVLSENDDGAFEIDAELLASRTAGIAHVATLGKDASWMLSEEVGHSLSVYGGAIRTYERGFDRYSARFRDHRLATAEWIRRRFLDSESFVGLLTRHAIDASVELPDLEERLPSFSSFRRAVAEQRLAEAKTGDKSQAELITLYEAENKSLQSELETALQIAEEGEEKATQYKRGQEDLEAIVYGLKQRIQSLKAALTSSGKEEKIDYPINLSEIDEWVPKYLGDNVHLMGRAIRGARKSVYEDVELVHRCLLLLGTTYRNVRLGLSSQEELSAKCAELGVEISNTGDRATLMQWRDQYEVIWRRERQFLDLHLKKGTSHDPRLCLRIYFFWDDDLEQVVVGYMTDHLQSSKS